MFITALCPTYRHPQLLANSLALWEMQDYPAERRRLIILDDGGTFDEQHGSNWDLYSAALRFSSLPAKYNDLLRRRPPETDAFLVWEDDDLYLPGYVSAHAAILQTCELSKPDLVLSDYPGGDRLQSENGAGRFHSSLAFRNELIQRVGGWPDTRRADFDQQLIAALQRESRATGSPWSTAAECQYVYGWHTGAAHGQHAMRSPEDESWYDRAAQIFLPVEKAGTLTAQRTNRARQIIDTVLADRGQCLRG